MTSRRPIKHASIRSELHDEDECDNVDLNLRSKKERKAEIHKLRIRDTHTHSTAIFLSKQVCVRVYTVREAIISIHGNFVPRTVKIG